MKQTLRIVASLMIAILCFLGMTSCNLEIYSIFDDSPRVGVKGPAGGYIFYDKGSYSDGWRYLEAAPKGWSGQKKDPTCIFGYYRLSPTGSNYDVGTGLSTGTGKANTESLVTAMGDEAYASESGDAKAVYAAKIASDCSVTVRGVVYDDWFLPSKDELNMMYKNLDEKSLGGFSGDYYWSSSESGYSTSAWSQYFFFSGAQGHFYCNSTYSVRPVRAF